MSHDEWFKFWWKENQEIIKEAEKEKRDVRSGEEWSYFTNNSYAHAERMFHKIEIEGNGAISGSVQISTVREIPNISLGDANAYEIQIDTYIKVTPQLREAIARAVVPSDLFLQPQTKP